MKIPFDVKFRQQIESGEYKVVTGDDRPVRIISWDANAAQPIVGLVYDSNEKRETVGTFCDNGSWRLEGKDSAFDLFILTPEPELTEFEQEVCTVSNLCLNLEMKDEIRSAAKQLLAISKKELFKEWNEDMKNEYARGKRDGLTIGYNKAMKEMDENRVYKHEGPYMPVYWPCHYGGECTNPFRDCINCHRQSADRVNTTTGTSTAKVDGKE